MTKALNNEIMAILRQYNVADDESSRRAISQVKELQPEFILVYSYFLFGRVKYFIIYDDSAEDDIENILTELRKDHPDIKGHLVQNPHDEQKTYGLRFKSKEVYLFESAPLKKRLDLELTERYPDISGYPPEIHQSWAC